MSATYWLAVGLVAVVLYPFFSGVVYRLLTRGIEAPPLRKGSVWKWRSVSCECGADSWNFYHACCTEHLAWFQARWLSWFWPIILPAWLLLVVVKPTVRGIVSPFRSLYNLGAGDLNVTRIPEQHATRGASTPERKP